MLTIDKNQKKVSVCLIDFAGNNREPGFWADYFFEDKKVVFGGSWCDVPDFFCDEVPTEEQLDEYFNTLEE